MNTAYLVKNNEIIAEIRTDLKNGTQVEYSAQKSYDALRQCYVLVNAQHAKISRAKKYQKLAQFDETLINISAEILYKSDAIPQFLLM